MEWYDGCNTCTWAKGQWACTEKACLAYETPACKSYGMPRCVRAAAIAHRTLPLRLSVGSSALLRAASGDVLEACASGGGRGPIRPPSFVTGVFAPHQPPVWAGGGGALRWVTFISSRLPQSLGDTVSDVLAWPHKSAVWQGRLYASWHISHLGPCTDFCADWSTDLLALQGLQSLLSSHPRVDWGVHRGRGVTAVTI